jgi:tetratricopeptide (TPR) repeat protein
LRIDTKASIKIVGILAILIGIWGIYKLATGFSLICELDLTISRVLSLLWPLAIVILFLISGFGLLRLKPWSREFLYSAVFLLLLSKLPWFLTWGPYTEGIRPWIGVFACGFFVWFASLKSVKKQFPPIKHQKLGAMIVAFCFFLVVVYWFYIWGFKAKAYQWPGLQKAVYTAKDESYYSTDYFRSPFPLKYTVAIPNQFALLNIEKGEDYGLIIILTNPQSRGIIWMEEKIYLETVFESLRPILKSRGYDAYRFCRKLFSERYGLVFQLYKSLLFTDGVYRLAEVQSDGLRGFIQKGRREKSWTSEYLIFSKTEPLGLIRVKGRRDQNSLDEKLFDEMVCSVRAQDKPFRSEEEFARDGMTFFDANDLEKAKFSFASALCLDWDNADYHYYLGRAFYKTANSKSAIEHLREAIRLRPDYTEAQELLQEIEMNQTNEK